MKKIILLLILSILFPTCVNASDFMDISEKSYKNEIAFLEKIGIIDGYEDGTFGVDKEVTRAEFSVMMSRMLNLNGISQTRYKDVDSNYWAANEIGLLSDFGLVTGTGGGMFQPDEKIEFSAAVKMVVTALGYRVYAENSGGYPLGYINAARSCNILSGVSSSDGNVTRGQLAVLLFNAGKAQTVELVSGGVKEKYENIDNRTLLSVYHDIYFESGTVTANSRTGLDSLRVGDGRIKIGKTVYQLDTASTYINDFLGYEVKYFYRKSKSDDEETVIFAYEDESFNKVTRVECENVDSFDKNTLVYTDSNGKKKRVEIMPYAYVVLNGVIINSYEESDFKDGSGTIIIVENSKADIYYVGIKKYTDYFVSTIYDDKIYNKYIPEKKFLIEEDDRNDKYTLIDSYGNDASISDISENDIISVAEGSDGFMEIIYASDRISGMVNGISSDNGKTVYRINDTEVTASNQLEEAWKQGKERKPEAGENITLSINAFGLAAGLISDTSVSDELALLVNGNINSDDDSIYIKFINSRNKKKNIRLNEKVKHTYNGVSRKITDSEMFSILKDGQSVIKRQIVLLKINSNDEITEIETAVSMGQKNKKDALCSFEVTDKSYKKTPMSFEGTLSISTSTVIFRHPADSERNINIGYSIGSADDFKNDGKYTFVSYSKYDSKLTPLAISIESSDTISDESSLIIVENISEVINKEGEVTKQIAGMQNGTKTLITLKDGTVLEQAAFMGTGTLVNVSEGDVIRVCTDSDEMVTKLEVLYDYDTSGSVPYGSETAKSSIHNSYTNILHLVYGKVTLMDDGYAKIETSDGTAEIHKVDKVKMMMYDSTDIKYNRLKSATVNDIVDVDSEDASRVLLRSRYGEVRDLIIFK